MSVRRTSKDLQCEWRGVGVVVVYGRKQLVLDTFSEYLVARRDFCLALERCAIKGWPDRAAALRRSTRLQELFFSQLAMRLAFLSRRSDDDAEWSRCSDTRRVQSRLQEEWTEQEEQDLVLQDAAYRQILHEISELQGIADPAGLEGPFKMAKRDPELAAAGLKLNNTTLDLDSRLTLKLAP
jgi:hypothetical protein